MHTDHKWCALIFTCTARGYDRRSMQMLETYSRKVFVGGVPQWVANFRIHDALSKFGSVSVVERYMMKYNSSALLLYREEVSVHRLVKSCLSEEGKLYMVNELSSFTLKLRICPWKPSDSCCIINYRQPLDPRKTIFIGVPHTFKACEVANFFKSHYGNVCSTRISATETATQKLLAGLHSPPMTAS